MPDGSEWDGLDTYFLLHGMSGADARAHTRNCTISELCAPRASAAPLLLPHSGGLLIVIWKPSYTAAPSAISAYHRSCFVCRLFPIDQAQGHGCNIQGPDACTPERPWDRPAASRAGHAPSPLFAPVHHQWAVACHIPHIYHGPTSCARCEPGCHAAGRTAERRSRRQSRAGLWTSSPPHPASGCT